MKKIITILLVMGNFVLGQNGFYQLDFETAGGYSTSVAEFTDNEGDFFTRSNGNNIASDYEISGKQGSYFFSAMDINVDNIGGNILRLNIDNIDIAGHSNLIFSILIAEDDDGINQDWDANSSLKISGIIDDGSSFDMIWVEAVNGTNSEPAIDHDFDGVGDVDNITSSFVEYTFSIPNTGSLLDIEFEFRYLDSGDEDIAIDNIRIGSTESPLPVELTTFAASVIEQSVELIWETATEVNNYGFEVERQNVTQIASNLSNWENIGFINGYGNSNSPKYYLFVDNLVEGSGKYYYRLKQIDIDGTYEFSDAVEVNLGSPTEFELNQNYPNPFNPTTSIQFNLPQESEVKLSVFNVLGEEVVELINNKTSAGYHSIQFDGAELNSGIYFYKLESKNFTQIRKMMLIK